MPTGTTENIDYFKNAPSDATHYVSLFNQNWFMKEGKYDVLLFDVSRGWRNYFKGTLEDLKLFLCSHFKIIASRSLKEKQDWEWEYLKGTEDHFRMSPEDAEIVEDYHHTTKFYYKTGKDRLLMWLSIWCRSPKIFSFGEDGSYSSNFQVLAVRRKVKKVQPENKVIKVNCVIKSTPTEDKTVQEFQNGQEVLWGNAKVFYIGESKEKGYSIIEVPRNQGIQDTAHIAAVVDNSSLSPVENKQEIQQKDLKQLKELLDSEINNWFNKLS